MLVYIRIIKKRQDQKQIAYQWITQDELFFYPVNPGYPCSIIAEVNHDNPKDNHP